MYVGIFVLDGKGPILLLKNMFFSTMMIGVGIFTLGGNFELDILITSYLFY